jgi:outer membrane lipoprotein-sorting protein
LRSTAITSIAILGALLLVLTACGSDESAALQEDITAQEVLENASARMAETESMHFRMDVEGKTLIDPAGMLRLLNAEGDLARPDRVEVEFQVEVLGSKTITIRMVSIGAEAWTTDLVTGNWVTAPSEFGYDPSILYDNQNGLGPVMGKVNNAELIGVDEIDGRKTYHVRGTSPGEVMKLVTGGTMQGEQIGLDLWIDGETWDLIRVVVSEPEGPRIEDPATWTMKLSNHNEQVDIEPPT